jgi:FtsH-binding integral membrane protein
MELNDYSEKGVNHKLISGICFIIVMCVALKITTNISNGSFSWNCQNPILGSYLYLLLGFVVMYFFSSIIAENRLDTNMVPFIGSIIMVFVLTFLVITMPPQNFGAKHLLWFAYLFCLSMILSPSRLHGNTVIKTLIISLGIFLTLSVFANLFKDFVPMSWERQLIYALLGLIIVSIISAVFFQNSKMVFTYISIISLIVFALFTLIDTRKLEMIDCNNPDYINNTLNLLLDSVNIFVNVYSLNNN